MDTNMRDILIEKAREVRENAYAPYSKFKVGAALLAKSGKIYTGANFENASFGAGTCAERVALGAALAAGEREFSLLVVAGGSATITPCGICRQALSEFAGKKHPAGDLMIICVGDDGDMRTHWLSGLLPFGFSI